MGTVRRQIIFVLKIDHAHCFCKKLPVFLMVGNLYAPFFYTAAFIYNTITLRIDTSLYAGFLLFFQIRNNRLPAHAEPAGNSAFGDIFVYQRQYFRLMF